MFLWRKVKKRTEHFKEKHEAVEEQGTEHSFTERYRRRKQSDDRPDSKYNVNIYRICCVSIYGCLIIG